MYLKHTKTEELERADAKALCKGGVHLLVQADAISLCGRGIMCDVCFQAARRNALIKAPQPVYWTWCCFSSRV